MTRQKNKKYKKKEISAVDISFYRLLAGKNFLKKKSISIEYLIKADGANLPIQDKKIKTSIISGQIRSRESATLTSQTTCGISYSVLLMKTRCQVSVSQDVNLDSVQYKICRNGTS